MANPENVQYISIMNGLTEADKQALELVREGKTQVEAARITGINRFRVQHLCSFAGIKCKTGRPRKVKPEPVPEVK